ncbi:MAG TPA: DNA-3-methyladenine glycosylase [Terriglobia bacterium]|nr:DNA-3-methyladenine glycosylase [Terriglobia bacterium]
MRAATAKSVAFTNGHSRLGLPHRLRRAELPVDTVELARYLVGKTLVHSVAEGTMSGRIVETEAYLVGDAAAHAFRGLTPRNRSLFLERGHAYVYFVYGCWYMLNVSSERAGVGAGVLLRALEPLEGVGLMERGGTGTTNGATRRTGTAADAKVRDLARGPGRLATAMRITKQHDGLDLCGSDTLWLGKALRPVGAIGESVRIGLTKEVDRVLRFYECGSPFVSGPRRLLT